MQFMGQLGVGGLAIAAVVWALSKLIPVIAIALKNDKASDYAVYPQCVLLNHDSARLRNIEIGQHIVDMLTPQQEREIELLMEIRDGVRDFAAQSRIRNSN